MTAFGTARLTALLLPLMLIGGALISEYQFGLYPCEMCHWQRWPHYAAIGVALCAFVLPGTGLRHGLVTIAALLIAMSGGIGIFHAGVEYGWWEGLTSCSISGPASLDDIFNTPMVRCDVAQWSLLGVSLAGYNALISLGGAGIILTLLRRARVLGK